MLRRTFAFLVIAACREEPSLPISETTATTTVVETATTVPAPATLPPVDEDVVPLYVLRNEQASCAGVIPVQLSGDVKPPRVISKVDPNYSIPMRKIRISSRVLLHAVINSEGVVCEVRVIEGDQDFARSAAEALLNWKFEPATIADRPVAVVFPLTVNFKLP